MNVGDFRAKLRSLPPRWRKRLVWTAALVAAYTLLGFLILPIIVRAVAVKRLGTLLHREVTIQKIRMNPYALTCSIRGLLIKDKDGQPFLSWDEAYANFQLLSFFGQPWVFKEIRLTQPFVRVQVNPDHSLNFSDLLEQFSQAARALRQPKKALSLRVSSLQITNASVSFTDLTPSKPFHRLIGPAQLSLSQFRTDPGNRNKFSFSGVTAAGEKFSWSGHFFLDPIRSDGEVSLEGLSLPECAPLYQDLVRFQIEDGIAGFRSAYRLSLNPTNHIAVVSNATFSLKSLKIAEKGSTEDFAQLDDLIVSGINADAVARSLNVNSFFASGGRLVATRARDQKVNLFEMARPADTATNAPGSVLLLLQAATNMFTFLLQSTNRVTAVLHELDVTNCAVVWNDLTGRRPVHVQVDRIAVNGQELSNRSGSNLTAAVSLRWNTNGTMRVETTAKVSPPAADVTLALNDIELRPLDPYLDPFASLSIIRSKLGLDGRIRMETTTNQLPDVTFDGEFRLDDFTAVDSLMAEDLVQWKSMRFSGLSARLVPPEATVSRIALIEPKAYIVVRTNGTVNVLTALKPETTNAPVAKSDAGPKGASADGKSGIEKRFGSLLRQALASSTNAAGSTLVPKVTVGVVLITNATLQFTDRSLQPNVHQSITDVHGTITGLSSEERKRADLQIEGKVGGTAPVEIAGKINALNQKAPTELQIAVHDVDLIPAGPYVGKYAGYRLSRGKLNLDLDYEISNRHLTASNFIVLDQFTLGEKVDSPEATKLPVRLAVAILKDRSGKIELDVPVEGNLDDPEFRLGKVISHAIVNVITKIVRSPFAALSAVFGGGGEELSFLDFAPGSAELQPNSAKKLEKLAKGLYERPGLSVEIEGSVDPAADRDALALQKLKHEFRVAKWTALNESAQAQIKPDDIEVKPAEFDDYVRQAYAEAFAPDAAAARTNGVPEAASLSGSSTVQPREPAGIRKGAEELVRKTTRGLPLQEMQRQLLQLIEITDADFRQLARQRAEKVREFLVQSGKVEVERILFASNPNDIVVVKGSRVYLQLR